jgi:UDP-N-acetylmuramoyl-L-alanyl-D-glutamate--2,6-diaminopimelate ligase
MRLFQLLKDSEQFPEIQKINSDVEIKGISFDSREVKEGYLFIALEGGSSDGHLFIPSAIKAGASAIIGRQLLETGDVPYFRVENPRKAMAHLAAAFYGFPARSLTVIGVTGTDGKTTTVNLIYHILLACGLNASMISTVNAVIGQDAIDTGFHVTTPESPTIQSLLRKMVDTGITHVVLETTSHGLDQFRVEACEFDLAVVTNITHEHLDYHGGYDSYFAAKFKLLEYLQATRKKSSHIQRMAAVNKDDISYDLILNEIKHRGIPGLTLIAYGSSKTAEVKAKNIKLNANGLFFDIDTPAGLINITSPLIGEYNVHNILAAAAVTAVGMKLPLTQVTNGIKNTSYVPGRMERIDLGQDFIAMVDFAHTPNALQNALETARKLAGGKVIVVFGSAGLRDRQKRRMMAAISAKLADITIMTAEDPRTENLADILEEMADEARLKGAKENKDFFILPDRGEAILNAIRQARKGDLVIACGKGHEQSMCFGEVEYPWDDRTAVRAALAEVLGIPGPEMPKLPTRNA